MKRKLVLFLVILLIVVFNPVVFAQERESTDTDAGPYPVWENTNPIHSFLLSIGGTIYCDNYSISAPFVLEDGSSILAIRTFGQATGSANLVVARVASNGTIMWKKSFYFTESWRPGGLDETYYPYALKIFKVPEKNEIVLCTYKYYTGQSDYNYVNPYFIKYDVQDGSIKAELEQNYYLNNRGEHVHPSEWLYMAYEANKEGIYFVTSSLYNESSPQTIAHVLVVHKLDWNFNTIWYRYGYGPYTTVFYPLNRWSHSISFDSNLNLITVATFSTIPSCPNTAYVIKYDKDTGEVNWDWQPGDKPIYPNPPTNYECAKVYSCVDSNGNLVTILLDNREDTTVHATETGHMYVYKHNPDNMALIEGWGGKEVMKKNDVGSYINTPFKYLQRDYSQNALVPDKKGNVYLLITTWGGYPEAEEDWKEFMTYYLIKIANDNVSIANTIPIPNIDYTNTEPDVIFKKTLRDCHTPYAVPCMAVGPHNELVIARQKTKMLEPHNLYRWPAQLLFAKYDNTVDVWQWDYGEKNEYGEPVLHKETDINVLSEWPKEGAPTTIRRQGIISSTSFDNEGNIYIPNHVMREDGNYLFCDVYLQKLRDGFCITSIAPDTSGYDDSINLTIKGAGFRDGVKRIALCEGDKEIAYASSIEVKSSYEISCSFNLKGIEAGNKKIKVVLNNNMFARHDYLVDYPSVTKMYPASGRYGEKVTITLEGLGFQRFRSLYGGLYIGNNQVLKAEDIKVINNNKITLTLDLSKVENKDKDYEFKLKDTVYPELCANFDFKAYSKESPISSKKEMTYFAEGSTYGYDGANGYNTYIHVENPDKKNTQSGTIHLYFDQPYNDKGDTVYDIPVSVKPQSKIEINVASRLNENVPPISFNRSFGIVFEKDIGSPLEVQRTMTYSGISAHTTMGSSQLSKAWYLPEGAVGWSDKYETWVLLTNFDKNKAKVTVTYLLEGTDPVKKEYSIDPYRRLQINAGNDLGVTSDNDPGKSFGVKVESNIPIMAEVSEYGKGRKLGTCSIGYSLEGTSNKCYLAEGSSVTSENPQWQTWLLLQNPNEKDIDIQVTAYPQGDNKQPKTFNVTVPKLQRISLDMLNYIGQEHFSMKCTSTGGEIFNAMRSMYCLNGGKTLGTLSRGYNGTLTAKEWTCPDGYILARAVSDGSGGTTLVADCNTFILISNPTDKTANVTIKYETAQGYGEEVSKENIPIEAGKRKTFSMWDALHGDIFGTPQHPNPTVYLVNGEYKCGVHVSSDQPIVVEEAIYFGYGDNPYPQNGAETIEIAK